MRKVIFLLALAVVLTHGCMPTSPAETPTTFPPQGVPESSLTELVIVYDNNPFDNRLRTAWGFSCLIRLPAKTILFDTGGDSPTLLHNMTELQIDAGEVDIVVLSHIHGDHVGGLSGFLEENSAVTVYLPQSFPQSFKDEVKSLGAKVEEVYEAGELFSGVYTTGELGNGTKEQSLIVTTGKGLVIITGCAHPGVANIIRVAKDVVPDGRVYLVIGGFHLAGASSAQIESVIQEFSQLSVENVAPCHCSGDETRRLFKERYREAYIESGVGKRVPLP
jgi:7,8-dihydropterin-6-yl-methyl-4-(beta-D-ribofuranosyl)aminobenzene 5'-phosphate synthase